MKRSRNRKMFRRITGCLLSAAVCFSAGAAITGLPVSAAEVGGDDTMYQLADSCQEGTILHCFNWSYIDVTESMREIAAAGFTSVQLSPAQFTIGSIMYDGPWYYAYQPVDMCLDYYSSKEDQLRALCREADKYGIKVIMDVVANHMVYVSETSPEEFKKYDYWHNKGDIKDYSDRTNITSGSLLGLRDLNTENKNVQTSIKSYVEQLYDTGVDGIRWDAAKHIALPSEGSDFWTTVLDERMYNYGEILNNPVDSEEQYDLMKEYASLMSVTDSTYGEELVNSFNQGKAPDTESKWMSEGIASDRLVFWGESHDTYSNGPGKEGATTRMSQNTIDKAYAVAAAREGSTALYLSRPSETESDKILADVSGSTHFTSREVSAVNHFHNAMEGRKDSVLTEDNCVVVSRENGGAVIVCGGEGGQVTLSNPEGYAVPGTYYDEVSGNSFTVTETSITGTVGESGIAVIYDSDFLGSLTADSKDVKYFYSSLDITLGAKDVENTAYEIAYTDESGTPCVKSGSYSDGDVITIGEGALDKTTITLTLTGTAINGKARKEVFSYETSSDYRTFPYSLEERWSECIFGFDNLDTKWEDVYFYAYSKDGDTLTENAPYPGEKMTYEGQELFSYKLSDKFGDKDIFVIFNNGKGAQISEGKYCVNKTRYPYGAVYSHGYWGDYMGTSIPPTGHNHTLVHNEAVSPTETEPGSQAYYSCTGCDKLYSDPAGLTEVTMEEIIIPATVKKDADDGKTDDSKTDDSKTDDSKTDDNKTDDNKSDDNKSDDNKTDDNKTDENLLIVPSDDTSPKTGDETPFAVIALSAVISALAALLIVRRRQREE